MKEWAYKRVEFTDEPPSEHYLNSQGEKIGGGWELAAITTEQRPGWLGRVHTIYLAYFKRLR